MTKRLNLALGAMAICLIEAVFSTSAALSQEPFTAPTPAPVSSADSPLSSFLGPIDFSAAPGTRTHWVSGDFLFGFVQGSRHPALVTASPPGTIKPLAGVLGADGTETLFGGDALNAGLRPGFRLQAGWWFGGGSQLGVEAGFLFVGRQSTSFFASSDQIPIIGRPYFDANAGSQQAVLVGFPGLTAGNVDVQTTSSAFYSGNIDITENALEFENHRLIAMVGYRFYGFDESLNIRQNLTPTDPNVVAGTQIVTNDSFATRNTFHGLDMGFRTEHVWGNLSLDLLMKLAIGDVRRKVTIAGEQVTTVPGVGTTVDAAGVLALGSNSGTFISHDWKVMPEVGATLGWNVRRNLQVRLGYSFLFLNGVARAGDQVDVIINPNNFPPAVAGGPNRPIFNSFRSDLWIQSINLGVLWTY